MRANLKRLSPGFTKATIGVLVCLGAASGLSIGYLTLGFLTGVFGICATAPEWWSITYSKLAFLIPIAAIGVGCWVATHQEGRPEGG